MNKETLHFLLIDNYDSFSYNLVEAFRCYTDVRISVYKNDDLSIFRDEYDGVVISPGPGLPHESAFLIDAIDFYKTRIPILGICLGLQAIVSSYGGKLTQLSQVYHGIRDDIFQVLGLPQNKENERWGKEESILFHGIPSSFKVGRYHSWVADEKEIPAELVITSISKDKQIMSLEDANNLCFGVQFHPESYMTEYGSTILRNFIALTREFHVKKAKITDKNESIWTGLSNIHFR